MSDVDERSAGPWAGVVGQPGAVRQLAAAVGAPVHAYLLVGPPGSGKRALARGFAAALLSQGATGDQGGGIYNAGGSDVTVVEFLDGVLPGNADFGALLNELDYDVIIVGSGYGGAIGYLSWDGDLDTAIHIRTVVVKDGQLHVQAGGGTVIVQDHYEVRIPAAAVLPAADRMRFFRTRDDPAACRVHGRPFRHPEIDSEFLEPGMAEP